MTRKQNGRSSKPSQDSKPTGALAFTKPIMNKQQILQSGEEAAALLNSPVYNLAVNSVVEDLGTQILQTEPHEHNRREWLYSQGSAIGRINSKLVEFVQMAQQLHMDAIASEESAQRQQDENRGFATAPSE